MDGAFRRTRATAGRECLSARAQGTNEPDGNVCFTARCGRSPSKPAAPGRLGGSPNPDNKVSGFPRWSARTGRVASGSVCGATHPEIREAVGGEAGLP